MLLASHRLAWSVMGKPLGCRQVEVVLTLGLRGPWKLLENTGICSTEAETLGSCDF